MKKLLYAILLFIPLAISFLAGSWYSQRDAGRDAAFAGRQILYYVDPMNPAHTSDKPGLAPCGMKMEPVYADEGAAGKSAMLPGTVKITPEKQQMIGVRVGQAEKTSGTYTVRTLGRVVIDENRIYRMITPVEGWVKEIHGGTTGSIVQKDQLLAHFYSRDILTPQQAYFYALNAMDRFKKESMDTPQQVSSTNLQIRSAEESLLALGMGEAQIKEIAKTRQATRDIAIRSPVSGLVLQRNIYPKLRFERGTEWYRIADISHVWVLADIFENEAHYFRPGTHARVTLPYQQKTFRAMVSETPPQFDPGTRTLKVRLEADNPGFILRPDMFVDVELPVQLPPALAVPVDAVLDSGMKKTVFVDLGNGFFEPRSVETGWRMGDRVEIVKGLMPGEKIVISGTFLLDSESRMKMAAAGTSRVVEARKVKDPVCGMDVDENKAKSAGLMAEHQGKTYYFCMDECKQDFRKNPDRYMRKNSVSASVGGNAGRSVNVSLRNTQESAGMGGSAMNTHESESKEKSTHTGTPHSHSN